jgi:L-lactate dehydrogenase
MNKIVLVGTGQVGMSYAYALLNQQTHADELVLVDINVDKTEGEAIDLRDGLGFSPGNLKIRAGVYADCNDADLVVITAGARQAEGETRMDLLRKNAGIFKPMIEEIVASGFAGIFLVVSNPMDVMTYLTWKYSGFAKERVIGSGTVLDSSRLRYAVGHTLGLNPKSVHAYMLGEHGDSEFVAWSSAKVGLTDADELLTDEQMTEIEQRVPNEAYEIIAKKGATYYGIGTCLAYITETIFANSKTILPVSNWDPFAGVYYGYPAIVGREGIVRRVGVELSDREQGQLDASIDVLKKAVEEAESLA